MPLILWLLSLIRPPSACRLLSVPLTRDPVLTYFIATATSDTVQTTAGKGPMRYANEFMSASTPPGLLPPPSPDTPVFGQVMVLERVGGLGAYSLRQRTSRGEGKALLVPWGYQANCSPAFWTSSALWNDPGSKGLFSAQLRPEREWVGGLPTFDVGGAWHQPYLHGQYAHYERPESTALQPELTLNELWELYEALPITDSLQANAARALEPAREWARSHPDQARRWPAPRILKLLEFLGKPQN